MQRNIVGPTPEPAARISGPDLSRIASIAVDYRPSLILLHDDGFYEVELAFGAVPPRGYAGGA
jgi:hypothetical protein